MNRRSFLKTTGLLVAAPAIVKAENIMKISVATNIDIVRPEHLDFEDFTQALLREIAKGMGVPYKLLARDFQNIEYRAAQPGPPYDRQHI